MSHYIGLCTVKITISSDHCKLIINIIEQNFPILRIRTFLSIHKLNKITGQTTILNNRIFNKY